MGSNKRGTTRGGGAQRAALESRAGYSDWVFTPQAEKEFDKFPDIVAGNFLDLIERVLDRQTRAGAGDVKKLDAHIFELRDRHKNNHYRVLWFVHSGACVAVTCFYKNQQKVQRQDLDRANARRTAYLRGQ